MALKNQFQKLKDNWLIIVVVVLLILMINNNSIVPTNLTSKIGYTEEDYAVGSSAGRAVDSYYPSFNDDFAPGVDDRKITKNVYESIKIKRGMFEDKLSLLKIKVSEYDAIILNENIYSNGEGFSKRDFANYNIKVKESDYKEFVAEIESLGDIESYSENAQDITGNYLDIQEQLVLENQRLDRYKALLSESKSIEEKISLTDRIFEQEKTIKYLEESLNNQDLRIDYVTINLNLNEEQSNFAGSLLVSLRDLIRTFVGSLNNLVTLLIYLVPWLVLIWIIRYFWKKK